MLPSSSMVRPVCRRLPSSIELWDDTNLPLSCVIAPLVDQAPLSEAPPPLASIPKCLHCGAPHPTVVSHYPFHGSLLCHLCAKTSPATFDDQAISRHGEPMDSDNYITSTTKRLPKASDDVMEFSLPLFDSNSFQIPAMNCPPIWWIVVEGSSSRQYWNVISSALSSVIENLPPYVHVGLLLVSSNTLSVWKVTSAVPFVEHFSWKKCRPDLHLADVGTYKSHLQTALRAMGDSMVVTEGGVPLVKTLELVLDQLEDGRHPGQPFSNGQSTENKGHCKQYAGGRILLLLNGPPQELKGNNRFGTEGTSRQVGHGGRGGACFETGMRFSTMTSDESNVPDLANEQDPEMGTKSTNKMGAIKINANVDDLTAKNLEHHFPHVNVKLMKKFEILGQQFAQAAVGLDILVIRNPKPQAVGLALLMPLCEPTGAPGPLLFDLTKTNTEEVLRHELWLRRPKHFGGLLRVRLSPGFKVDGSNLQGTSKSHFELANTQVRKGLMGPAAYTDEESLWQMGSVDEHQCVNLDFQVTNKIQRRVFAEGMGEVVLKPCVQVCFAYTTFVASNDVLDDFVTVRRIRICSLHLPMSDDVESLYAALDPEALSVVLFHKFVTTVLTEGVVATQDIGRDWLKFIMVGTYRSAQVEWERQQANAAHGIASEDTFFPAERLLIAESTLGRDDILLGQGHAILRSLPLLVWCLLQSDAMRPSSDTYRPTLDARAAALMQMTSMSPWVLARCLAPRLDLWPSGPEAEEPILTSIDLSLTTIATQVKEYQQVDPNLILFFDSPFGILVCDSRHFSPSEGTGVVASQALQKAVQYAVKRYPTPPSVTWALDISVPLGPLWKDFLIEDAFTSHTHQDFADWKKDLADAIFDEVSENADY